MHGGGNRMTCTGSFHGQHGHGPMAQFADEKEIRVRAHGRGQGSGQGLFLFFGVIMLANMDLAGKIQPPFRGVFNGDDCPQISGLPKHGMGHAGFA